MDASQEPAPHVVPLRPAVEPAPPAPSTGAAKAAAEARRRAASTAGQEVGKLRHQLFRDGFRWINRCLEQGFFIEAICLLESLIADRLEGRLTVVLGRDFSFKTLERLISRVAGDEADPELKRIVTVEVQEWKDSRNRAAHEMLKIAEGECPTWADRYLRNEAVARRGLELLRKVDARIAALKRQALKFAPRTAENSRTETAA